VTGLQARDTDRQVRRDNPKQIRPPAGTAIPIEGLTDQEAQTPIHEVVSDYLRYLNWEADDDFPSSLRLRQYPDSVPVVIDPRFGHGTPVVAANRVAVKAITDLWEAGESVEDIAYDFDMTPEQVDELCRAVVRLAA
jgi:uncharacterized protein (DUF433 family)